MHSRNNFVSGLTGDRSYGRIRKTIHDVINDCHSGTAGRAIVFNQKYLELTILHVSDDSDNAGDGVTS